MPEPYSERAIRHMKAAAERSATSHHDETAKAKEADEAAARFEQAHAAAKADADRLLSEATAEAERLVAEARARSKQLHAEAAQHATDAQHKRGDAQKHRVEAEESHREHMHWRRLLEQEHALGTGPGDDAPTLPDRQESALRNFNAAHDEQPAEVAS